MTKNEIIEFCSGCNGAYHLRESYFKKNFEKEYEEICSIEFPEHFSFSQKVYHWLHEDIKLKLGICPTCGNRCKFLSFGRGYETYCYKQCIYTNERSEKCKSTKKERYGDSSYNNIDKNKKTCLEKYGVENVSQIEEIKQRKINKVLNRSEIEKQIYREKIRNTWDHKNIEDVNNHVNKIKEKKKIRYGDKNYNNREKFNQTTHSKEYSAKKKKRYDKTALEYELRKIKTNGGVSKIEIEFYDWLCNHFNNNDVLVQYSSDLYPYHCDFYIKSLDLYIELNGHWTHGCYPFIGDEKDLKRIEYWKSKKSEYYETAIRVWSIVDVKKQKIAKENNLNYLTIYSNNLYECIKTFNKFINDNKNI